MVAALIVERPRPTEAKARASKTTEDDSLEIGASVGAERGDRALGRPGKNSTVFSTITTPATTRLNQQK